VVRDEDHGAVLDRHRDPLRRRLRALLPRLHLLPALSGQLDQWTEWLVRTRFSGWTEAEIAEALARLGETRERVLDGAVLEAGDIVADVGAGTGLLTLAASRRVGIDGDVIALDISVDALEELRSTTAAANISYLVGQADVLPLPDETVDAVVTRSVLIYVPDKEEAAREFVRVLRPAGRVSLFEPINSRNLRLWEAIDFAPLGELGRRLQGWTETSYANTNDPMLNFDEHDLERSFVAAGLVDVVVELGATEETIEGARYLNQVGAPGRPTVLERWREAFPAEDVERLAGFVGGQSIRSRSPHVFVTGRKR
jgi:SAM-dependent methyltransferase